MPTTAGQKWVVRVTAFLIMMLAMLLGQQVQKIGQPVAVWVLMLLLGVVEVATQEIVKHAVQKMLQWWEQYRRRRVAAGGGGG